MLLSITSPNGPDVLNSLADWLRRDPELRGVQIRMVAPSPGPEDMGAVSGALAIVHENSELLTAAATTIGVWLGSRMKGVKVRIRDGEREVEVEAGRLGTATTVAERILDQLGAAPGAKNPDGASDSTVAS